MNLKLSINDVFHIIPVCVRLSIFVIFAQIFSMELKTNILAAWENRELLKHDDFSNPVRAVIEEVDKGRLRVAEKNGDQWQVN